MNIDLDLHLRIRYRFNSLHELKVVLLDISGYCVNIWTSVHIFCVMREEGGGGGGEDMIQQARRLFPMIAILKDRPIPLERFPGWTRKTWKDFRDEHRKLSEEFTAKNHHYWICFHRDWDPNLINIGFLWLFLSQQNTLTLRLCVLKFWSKYFYIFFVKTKTKFFQTILPGCLLGKHQILSLESNIVFPSTFLC